MDTFEDLLHLTPSKLRPVALKLKDVILAIVFMRLGHFEFLRQKKQAPH